MVLKRILNITFLKEHELIFDTQLNGFKYFYLIQIILFYYLFVQFNVLKYFYLTLTVQLNISHLFTHT